MRPVLVHRPGQPSSPTPPERLAAIVDHFRPQPPVVRWGLTVTRDGRWALLVSVPAKTNVPLAAVESASGGFPVVYEVEPDQPIVPLAD